MDYNSRSFLSTKPGRPSRRPQKNLNAQSGYCKIHKVEYYTKNGRCYGYYRCPTCQRSWESGNSWIGYGQKCSRCNINVMAYCQHPKEISLNHSDPVKPHPMSLCQKCQSLGKACYETYGRRLY